jgi:hypothetical protein
MDELDQLLLELQREQYQLEIALGWLYMKQDQRDW